jgi:hypothetical protein
MSDDVFGKDLVTDFHERALGRLGDGERGGLRGAEETKGGEEVRETLKAHVESESLVADENVGVSGFCSTRMQGRSG